MERKLFRERGNWKKRCEDSGFLFHTIEGERYWQEGVAYCFSLQEIDAIDDATLELHSMCISHVEEVVKSGDYEGYSFPDWAKSMIESSWKKKDPHIYGRFDFCFRDNEIKLLEYNADTPTSLLEAAVIQWNWLEDLELPDQFNSIHEKLIERWQRISDRLPLGQKIYLSTIKEAGDEDWGNLSYLAETAVQADKDCSLINLEDIGWQEKGRYHSDIFDNPIVALFKLYPWEWLLQDDIYGNLAKSSTLFLEPAWKMLLSNKALLPLLWKKHPDHPFLLPAYFESENKEVCKKGKWVRKPCLAREGSNISLFENGRSVSLSGSSFVPAYDADYVLQQWCDFPSFDGWHPVIGSWVVGDDTAGIGIREDKGLVTGNSSCFAPHYFEERIR